MTNIFITIPWFVPAFRAGGPIQSIANLVKEHSDDVQYRIFCGDTDLNGAVLEGIETNKWIPYNESTYVWYSEPGKTSETLVKLVEKENPDILFIVGIFSWHYNIVPLLFCKARRKILSTRGMLHPEALTQKKWKKKVFLSLFKLWELPYKVDFHATDEEEAAFIRSYFPGPVKVFVAGNLPTNIGKLPLPDKEPGRLKLLTIAVISPMKNILMVLTALQKVTDAIHYDIYGPVKDEEYWDKCKEQVKTLPENIEVIFHKEIEPLKIKEALAETHVFVLPSKSENFGHALFEALSSGRPLITSNNTPWKRLLEAKAGINVSSNDAMDVANAIHFFAHLDNEQMKDHSEGAFAYAQKAVDGEKIKNQYKEMFNLKP